jgi:hypothetical protein
MTIAKNVRKHALSVQKHAEKWHLNQTIENQKTGCAVVDAGLFLCVLKTSP